MLQIVLGCLLSPWDTILENKPYRWMVEAVILQKPQEMQVLTEY